MFLLWVSYSIFVLLTAQNYARFFSMSFVDNEKLRPFFAIQLFLNLSYHLLFCVAIVAEFDCLMISFDYAIWNMVTNEKQYFVFYDYTIIVNPNKELKLLVDSFNFLFVFMVLNVIGYWFFYT